MLKEVARANALDVCPEGNEGLPTADFWVISGYVMNGRSRLTAYLTAKFIPEFKVTVVSITQAFLNKWSSSLANPMAPNAMGIPVTR